MDTQQAIFAAGCFWGVQYYFDQVPGVIQTTVGYTGGSIENPTYEEVCRQKTGHAEATLINFDPQQVTYQTLVRHFFRMHDPTQLNRQGPDVGDNYRSAIFYKNETQKLQAAQIKADVQKGIAGSGRVVTEITATRPFYKAEAYHQKYSERTGMGMCHIPYQPIK